MKVGWLMLVFDDFGNCPHRTFFDTFAAADAGIFGYDFGNAGRNVEHILRTSINANAAADAIVFDDHRTRHFATPSLVPRALAH